MSEEKNRAMKLGENIVPENEWRKFHKITPLSQLGSFWLVIGIVLYSFVQNFLQTKENWEALQDFVYLRGIYLAVLIALGILLFVSIFIVLISWLSWRKMRYAIAESGIHLRKGIFFVKHTQMRWDRVQTVDVQQTLFGRIFGFGSVQISSAGTDEDIKLGLLRLKECANLRQEVLKTLNLVRSGLSVAQIFANNSASVFATALAEKNTSDIANTSSDAKNELAFQDVSAQSIQNNINTAGGMRFLAESEVPFADADQAEKDTEIFSLSLSQLIVANILGVQFLPLILFAIFGVAIPIIIDQYIVAFFALIGLFWSAVKSLFDDFGTKIFLSENGLRRRSGLTTVRTRTYPPQRIHAVELKQPILWRKLDWWQINVTVAGNGPGDGEELIGKLVCAADKEATIRLLWTILPKLGSANDAALIEEAMRGSGSGEFFQGASKRAKLLDPISLPGRGFFAAREVFIIREGRWGRKIIFVLQDHTQSLRISQGPVQSFKGLATFSVHTVISAINPKLKNFDHEVVAELAKREFELTQIARAEGVSETLNEWKMRLGLLPDSASNENNLQ